MTVRTILSVMMTALATSQVLAQPPKVEVVKREDVQFIPLNPARGDASPQAGTLWGDIREDVPSGAIITFADNFASPPHIHNITYRAVVIEGTVHNDDPNAKNMWMNPGSFWTQPAGEVHITSVGPNGGTAFLEILSGPYLVRPMSEAFDNGELPINVEKTNLVWLDSKDVKWVKHGLGSVGPEVAFLWGTPEEGTLNGTFVKLPYGYTGTLTADNGASLKAVLVQGTLTHGAGDKSPTATLDPGSYFGSEGTLSHELICGADKGCILYVRTAGTYQVADSK